MVLMAVSYTHLERTLQVSIEACIGVAKHWAKALASHTPQDAYQAFEILAPVSYTHLLSDVAHHS